MNRWRKQSYELFAPLMYGEKRKPEKKEILLNIIERKENNNDASLIVTWYGIDKVFYI
jgi:hypothetical protein